MIAFSRPATLLNAPQRIRLGCRRRLDHAGHRKSTAGGEMRFGMRVTYMNHVKVENVHLHAYIPARRKALSSIPPTLEPKTRAEVQSRGILGAIRAQGATPERLAFSRLPESKDGHIVDLRAG
jgi:hypothetical protein